MEQSDGTTDLDASGTGSAGDADARAPTGTVDLHILCEDNDRSYVVAGLRVDIDCIAPHIRRAAVYHDINLRVQLYDFGLRTEDGTVYGPSTTVRRLVRVSDATRAARGGAPGDSRRPPLRVFLTKMQGVSDVRMQWCDDHFYPACKVSRR